MASERTSYLAAVPRDDASADGSGTTEERFAKVARGVYGDRRADPAVRELLLAIGYAVTVGAVPGEKTWTTVRRALGGRRSRLREVAVRDLPRYVVPGSESFVEGSCGAARHRAYVPRGATGYGRALAADDRRNTAAVCGSPGTIRVTELDLTTGWHRLYWYCSRHRAEADRVRAQLKEPNKRAPDPVPNAGGLLPAYFKADWLVFYRWAAGSAWKPPSYGLCADDWPTVGGVASAHPRLRLVVGDFPGDVG